VSGALGYRVYRDGGYVGYVYGGSFVDAGLASGSYGYQVAAADADGRVGMPTTTVTVTVTTPAPDAIDAAYQNLGGIRSTLGRPMSGEYALAGGTVRNYMFGWILLAPGSSVAHYSTGAINARYVAAGGPSGPLGFPLADLGGPMQNSGWGQQFQGGSIYWTAATGAHTVTGPIRDKWAASGWEAGALGYPTTDTIGPMGLGGYGQQFANGSIYWTAGTGAHSVVGNFRDTWASWGWEAGSLGYPTTDTICGMRMGGCGQQFQGGSIYGTSYTGPHVVLGAYRDKWSSWGWEAGSLGYPTSDTSCGMRNGGCGQQFEGGSIYSSWSTGTHVVLASMRGRWASWGWEAGFLGYPTTDTICGMTAGGCGQQFQGGSIYSSWMTDAHTVAGPIRSQWAALGWEAGRLAYPTTEEYATATGTAQRFQGGTVTWTRKTNRLAVTR
jgi:uncharacterized protein with LGFP repeats